MTADIAVLKAALSRVVAMGETEPAGMPPGSGFDKLCGWVPGKPGGTFSDFSKFPEWEGWPIPGTDKKSHAAGRHQFEPRTFAWVADQAGLTDFSPASQEAGFWYLADFEYRKNVHRDLAADLMAGHLADIVPALRSTWPSLSEETFPPRWQQALGELQAAPAPVPQPVPAPAPVQPPSAPTPPSPVHGGVGTAGAAGVAFALVDLATWLLSIWHIHIPGNAQADLVTILTALSGFWVHGIMARASRRG
jgi:muramidase (phage lysozyme)